MPNPRVKGSALRARTHYVEERGPEAVAAFHQMLTFPTREEAERGFDPDTWYPFAMFVELCQAVDRLHGRGDMELCFELGRYSADLNLPSLYKLMFRVGNVHWAIRRAASAWKVIYSVGRMVVVEEHDKSVCLRIEGWPDPRRAHCLSVRGWIVRTAELSGEKVGRHRETCRVNGDTRCQFWVDIE